MPSVSVVIPVYNTEALLPRCLDSLLRQTYPNLEVIVVDDHSPGNASEIVRQYQKADQRVKLVRHDTNRGLFHARLSGADQATGDYIAFLDSDDYLAVDAYRLLVNKALSANADIVYMNFVFENEKEEKWVPALNRPFWTEISGEAIYDEFIRQEGKAFYWHVVWNKLLSKKLWDQCRPYYERITDHLIMTEDLVYSCVLLYHARKIASVDYDGIFYYQRSDASTSASGSMEKFTKNIRDLKTSFTFFESFLAEKGLYDKYEAPLKEWKTLYYRYWVDNISNSTLKAIEQKVLFQQLRDIFGLDDRLGTSMADHYFGFKSTTWDDRYENLKRKALDPQIKVISFDVFDTLIQRPFFEPRDLFHLMDPYYEQLVGAKTSVNFSEVRREAEEVARLHKSQDRSMQEEITLDEVYQLIAEHYQIDENLCSALKQREIELELQYCVPRYSLKEIFEMVRMVGKRIVIVSDMYLPAATVEQLLHKNGYVGYDRLYVSSELRMTKASSSLYQKILSDLDQVSPSEVLHIGDNWYSDHEQASRLGIQTWFYPKAIDIMMNRLPDAQSGMAGQFFEMSNGMWENYKYATQYFGIRVMLGLIAIKHFDNPYRTFNRDSDFNSDPRFIGYYAFGMHLFGLAKWLLDDTSQSGYDTIHFVARDGYFVKEAYDRISKHYPHAPKSNYLHLSRKSLLPAVAYEESPYVLSRFTALHNQTPRNVLTEMLKLELTASAEQELADKGVILDKFFASEQEFRNFVESLMETKFYRKQSADFLSEYARTVRDYFDRLVGARDVLFDIGYSGTSQMILSKLLKRPVDAYYVHTNHDKAYDYARKFGFKVHSFYDFTPAITGPVREYIISETGPSCIGYQIASGTIKPEFEPKSSRYIEEWLLGHIHQSGLEFVQDIVTLFGPYLDLLIFRNREISAPFEYFLHFSSDFDRSLFAACAFEDHVFHGSKDVNIYSIWNDHLLREQIGNLRMGELRVINSLEFLKGRSKYMKGLFYLLFLRDVFKEKFKQKMLHRPGTLRLMRKCYRGLRSVKRILIK